MPASNKYPIINIPKVDKRKYSGRYIFDRYIPTPARNNNYEEPYNISLSNFVNFIHF